MWIKGAKFRAGHSHVSLRSSLILSQIDELENRDKSCVIAGEKNLEILSGRFVGFQVPSINSE